jgi:hypothetical protein
MLRKPYEKWGFRRFTSITKSKPIELHPQFRNSLVSNAFALENESKVNHQNLYLRLHVCRRSNNPQRAVSGKNLVFSLAMTIGSSQRAYVLQHITCGTKCVTWNNVGRIVIGPLHWHRLGSSAQTG